MKTLLAYKNIERNKPNYTDLIDTQLKKALVFNQKNIKLILKEFPKTSNDEKLLYELSRKIWNKNAPKVFEKKDITLIGPYKEIVIRLYRKDNAKNKPCIVYFHGGGFTTGSINSHDGIVSRLCNYTGATIVSVNYKLAPKYHFPTPVKEGIFVLEYLRKSANQLRINSDSISLAGDSAGAFISLAIFLSLQKSKKDISYIQTLLLYYGSYGLSDSVSKRLYGNNVEGMSYYDLDIYENNFFGKKGKVSLFDYNYDKIMPKTYILACELDPLFDDSFLLYKILNSKGHVVKITIKKGYTHGFLHYSNMFLGSEISLEESATFFKKYH